MVKKMSKVRSIDFDVEKVRSEFDRRGLTFREVSYEIGRERGYIQRCMATGRMPVSYVKLLKALYNLEVEPVAQGEPRGGVQTEQLPGQLVWTWTSSGKLSIKSVEEL